MFTATKNLSNSKDHELANDKVYIKTQCAVHHSIALSPHDWEPSQEFPEFAGGFLDAESSLAGPETD